MCDSEKAYRYEDVIHASGWEEYGYTHYVQVYLRVYTILKHTPKGFWITHQVRIGDRWKRFVLSDARRKFAYLTKEEALESFKKRKERQISLLKTKLKHAENALRQAGGMIS